MHQFHFLLQSGFTNDINFNYVHILITYQEFNQKFMWSSSLYLIPMDKFEIKNENARNHFHLKYAKNIISI